MTGTTSPRTIPGGSRPGAGDVVTLETLLATERELTRLVTEAHEEARRIVAAAEARVATIESTAGTALAAAMADLEAGTQSETARAISEAREAAQVDVARFDSVPDETIRELADAVLRDFLLAGTGAP